MRFQMSSFGSASWMSCSKLGVKRERDAIRGFRWVCVYRIEGTQRRMNRSVGKVSPPCQPPLGTGKQKGSRDTKAFGKHQPLERVLPSSFPPSRRPLTPHLADGALVRLKDSISKHPLLRLLQILGDPETQPQQRAAERKRSTRSSQTPGGSQRSRANFAGSRFRAAK